MIENYTLWTALITPLSDSGSVDFESLTKLVDAQEAAGNGLLILGSTGEALNINSETKKAILEHVLNLGTRAPIMVGVGGHLLEEQKEWLSYLETKNVHAYLLVTPHYAKPGAQGQIDWFYSLMEASTRPCMLYNVPGRTGVALSTEAVTKLSPHRNFWAIKEASGSVEKFKTYLQAANGKPVLCGDDALMPEFAEAGATGLVSVASNVWPEETHLYVKLCLKKDFHDHELWRRASNSLFMASNPVPVKRLMFETGMIRSPKLLPPLSHKDLPSSADCEEVHVQIRAWYQQKSQKETNHGLARNT
jgi:4-hydroxy-tetrahydrodipicolinate synthase